jgi:hypothetical protein
MRRAMIALLAVGLVAAGAALGSVSPAAAAVDIGFDGEAGTLAGISSHGGASVTAGAARHGAGGLLVSGTNAPAFARWNTDVVPQGHTHASARLWVRLMSRKAGESVDLFSLQNGRRVENFDIFLNGTTGQIQWDLYREDTDATGSAMELGRWYLIEAQVEFAAGEYTATVRVDGVDQGTIASTLPSTTVRAMWVGAETAKTHTQHYDDLAVQVGDAPMGWLPHGPPSVELTTPAEGGTYGRGTTVPAAYACTAGDVPVATCAGPVATGAAIDTGTLGPHQVTVTATDVTGAATSVTHHYTVVDVTAPTVQVTAPAHGATYAPGQVVAADYACADEGGGSGLAACAGPVADGAAIDTTTLGTHDFTVTAIDAAGNPRSVTHTYVVADTADPLIDLRSPAEGGRFAVDELVAADFDCADAVALAACVGTVADGAAVDTATLGEHDFTVTATDAAGNEATVTHVYEVVDEVAPVVELRRPADGAVLSRGAVVDADFACEDEAGGSGIASCVGTRSSGGPVDTTVLGTHEFAVIGTDAAGNATTVTHAYTVVDRTSPAVVVRTPADGAVYARGARADADFECADEVGGGGLRAWGSCLGPVALGAPIDTWTLGDHDFTVTGQDAADNVGQATSTYTVLPNLPDNLIALGAGSRFAGDDVYDRSGVRQTRTATLRRGQAATFLVRVENDTGATDRFAVRGRGSNARWRVRYFTGGREVTAAVVRGTFRSNALAPDRAVTIKVVVQPTRRARAGHQVVVGVSSASRAGAPVRDQVRAVVRLR